METLLMSRLQGADWEVGRAGMLYRDVIPGRLGGAVIGSHIRIPGAGPTDDYVHYHAVKFMIIYCVRGSAELVYENQGPAFRLEAGDCVLQPPLIRHKVIASADDLEVVEIAAPAEYATAADESMSLPDGVVNRDRDFSGQRFWHHRAADAVWTAGGRARTERCDLGIASATDGVGSAAVVRGPGEPGDRHSHSGSLQFHYVLAGSGSVIVADAPPQSVAVGDAFVVPPKRATDITGTADFVRLEISMPA